MSGNTGGAPTGGGYHDTTFYTKFNLNDFNGLKKMLDGASVQTVKDVASNWQGLHDDLVGADGQSGIQKRFTDAVNKVMQTWHGKAADRFQKKAQEIVQNFQNGAPYALQTAQVMGQTAKSLQDAIDKVNPIQDGWNWDDNVWSHMPWDDSIDDDDLNDLLKSGASTAGVLEVNKDNLTGHQKHRLQAAAAMEILGTSYRTQAASLKAGPGAGNPRQIRDDRHNERSDQKDLGGMPMPMGLSGGPGGGGGGNLKIPTRGMKKAATPKMPEMPKMPDQPGISGGMGSVKPKMPDVTTGLDGLNGGGGSGGPGLKMPGGGAGGLPGGGGAGLHAPSGGGVGGGIGGMPPGVAGGAGMGGRGAGGLKGGAGGLKGGASGLKGGASGAGAAGAGAKGAGRAGMPGMGGAHGAAGKGAGAKGGGGASGPQARQKGGIIGKTGGKASGGAQGGSGLHRSRGGTAAGTNSGGRRPAGMMGGAHGAHGGKGEGKGQDGNRPDYLVEDEETWTPERNVAPRVIE
ncbi:hypothetical protein [Streptomyces sp. NPDC093707]|uniref:hypothetical protein n=1 Tax=Streptomyces sp. NPDC093707 TaxID=3154984 RepID=UPI00344D3612